MPKRLNDIEAAARRVGILKEIVRRERRRAESNPDDLRYVEIGIIEDGMTKEEARTRVAETFDELGYLLDHLNIAHMAASFEAAALERLKRVIGETRTAVEKGRQKAGPWPRNLVRDLSSFEGLSDIGVVLSLDKTTQEMFKAIRDVRNKFGHAPKLDGLTAVTGSDTLDTLSSMLERIR